MTDRIARRYLRFPRTEAAGRSPLHEALARHVGPDGVALGGAIWLVTARA